MIVEVGAEAGAHSRKLLEWSDDVVLHAIDPAPKFDVEAWESEFGRRFVFHADRSLNALPEISDADIVLIDGDHNWFTVHGELELIARAAERSGRPLPVIALHDLGWPYGRRDMYYEPEAIPPAFRQPHMQLGMRPGSGELVSEGGLNPHLDNAIYEHDVRNGVRTAVEDFIHGSPDELELVYLPGLNGLGVIVSVERLRSNKRLRKQVKRFRSAAFLTELCEFVELARVEQQIAASSVRDQVEPRTDVIELERALEARETEVARREAALAAGDVRVEQYLATINELRRELRQVAPDAERLRVELERAVGQREDAVADSEAHQRLLALARTRGLELESQALERLEAALTADAELRGARRRGQLLEAERELVITDRDALRAQVETMRPARTGASNGNGGAPGEAGDRDGAESPDDPEAALRSSFRARFAETIEQAAVDPQALSFPLPVDAAGLLVEAGHPNATAPTVDVVVCVHNALDDVRRCIWSLLAKGTRPFHLILVNDGSDDETTAWLREFAARTRAVELHERLEPPHGYTLAANTGLAAAQGDYVALLNSDTIVTPGWMERIVAAGESDSQVAVLGPLSNAASHQSVPALRDEHGWATNPLPDWATVDAMALLVACASEHLVPRVPFINGFCFVIRRAVLDELGLFDDELFAAGYCEENDFCFRAGSAGHDLAIVDDAYVYHAKSRSYGVEGRRSVAREHYQRFLDKHGPEDVTELVELLESDRSLQPLRDRVARLAESRDSPRGELLPLLGTPLDVIFVLPGMPAGSGGGVHSIYQEVRGMRDLGIPSRVALGAASWERALDAYPDASEVFAPYSDEDELAELTASSQIVVATHFESSAVLRRLAAGRDDFLPAYYIQDYEPFFQEASTQRADEAVLSYGAVEGVLAFAKTHWLCNLVGLRHGVRVAKVEPSLDHAVYHPGGRRERSPGEPLRVAAMVRPRTPRRQPGTTVAMLGRLAHELGRDVEVITFGCTEQEFLSVGGTPQAATGHRGLLTRNQVADMLREADVFLDCSLYQAFGRTGLEAMACGCVPILPVVGGAHEFAEDDRNAFLVDTLDPDSAYSALCRAVYEQELVPELRANGLNTAAGYSVLRAALSEYALFEHAYRLRFPQARQTAS